jgi:hypothetical protein
MDEIESPRDGQEAAEGSTKMVAIIGAHDLQGWHPQGQPENPPKRLRYNVADCDELDGSPLPRTG